MRCLEEAGLEVKRRGDDVANFVLIQASLSFHESRRLWRGWGTRENMTNWVNLCFSTHLVLRFLREMIFVCADSAAL